MSRYGTGCVERILLSRERDSNFYFSRKAEVWTYSRSPAALRAAASASFRSKKTSHFTNTLSRIVKSW